MSALRIGESAELREDGVPLSRQGSELGQPGRAAFFQRQGKLFFNPEVSFQVEGILLLTNFGVSSSLQMLLISLVNLKKITQDAHLNSNFIIFGNQPVHEEQEFS